MQNDDEQKLPRLSIGVFPLRNLLCGSARRRAWRLKVPAFLPYSSLVLEFCQDCPAELRGEIIASAAPIHACNGEQYQISGCGQNVLLGGEKRA